MPPSRRRAAQALRNSSGALSTAATARMSTDLPWFDDLSAEDRSWVGLIVQAGIRGFVEWYDVEVEAQVHDPLDVVVFGAAPRELTGVISLQQTVELVRLSIRVVETNIDALLDPQEHRHPGPILGYVVDGQMRSAINHEPDQIVPAGGTFYEPFGALHTTFGSAGQDAPVRIVAFMVVPTGSRSTVPADAK